MTPIQICNLALSFAGASGISSLADTSPQADECNNFYEIDRDVVLADHDWDFARKRCTLTPVREVNFDAGQTAEPSVGATVTQDADTYGTVVYVDLQSGTWAGNDAAGIILLSDPEGTFEDGESITWSGGQATVNEPDGYDTSDYSDWGYSYIYPSNCLAARRILNSASDELIKYEVCKDQSGTTQLILTDAEDAVLIYTFALTDTTLFDKAFIFCLAYRLAVDLAQALRGDTKLQSALMQNYVYHLARAQNKNANESKEGINETNPYIDARG